MDYLHHPCFQGLQVKEIGNNSGERLALSHLRPQLVNLLTNALQVETDPSNTQMLLGKVILFLWMLTNTSVHAVSYNKSSLKFTFVLK